MAKKRERKISDTVIAYRTVFDSEAGKRVLYDLAKVCHMLTPVHFPGDPYETAYRDGERSVILRIMRQLAMDPDHLLELIKQGQREDAEYVG